MMCWYLSNKVGHWSNPTIAANWLELSDYRGSTVFTNGCQTHTASTAWKQSSLYRSWLLIIHIMDYRHWHQSPGLLFASVPEQKRSGSRTNSRRVRTIVDARTQWAPIGPDVENQTGRNLFTDNPPVNFRLQYPPISAPVPSTLILNTAIHKRAGRRHLRIRSRRRLPLVMRYPGLWIHQIRVPRFNFSSEWMVSHWGRRSTGCKS